jgi:hypothetical protein
VSVKQVHLIDGTTGDFVAATLHENLKARNLELIERVWSEHRARLMADLLRHGVSESKWPQSLHWNWTAKAGDLGLLAVNGTGVEIHGEWHALMMTKTVPDVARHPGDRGMPIVYVDYVESAPWNWHIPALTPLRPRFKGAPERCSFAKPSYRVVARVSMAASACMLCRRQSRSTNTVA